tara:strand:- start:1328 stop:1765 length:438 start_codon:yes stop_codon:yes gene_type:complete
MIKTFLLCLITVFAFSCSKKLGPDESLREIVKLSISGKMSKDQLLSATTSPLRDELAALSEEDMNKYLKIEGASKDSFQINLSNCEELVCYLTYTLKYDTSKDGVKTFGVELKKMAELKKVDEKWLLADITDIKTYYEAQQPIEP